MRLIDADALVSELWNGTPNEPTHDNLIFKLAVGACIHEINHANTIDAVPVVRCKDCKHFDGESCCENIGLIIPNGAWFCADGERREEHAAD